MKRILTLLLLLILNKPQSVICIKSTSFKIEKVSFKKIKKEYNYTKVSWYGPGFNGRKTANGEIFNQDELVAASPYLPFNTKVLIINPINSKSIVVRINDRGPFKMHKNGKVIRPLEAHPNRTFDLSKRAFSEIANLDKGIIKIKYKIIK